MASGVSYFETGTRKQTGDMVLGSEWLSSHSSFFLKVEK
jgi:hypothetical protein